MKIDHLAMRELNPQTLRSSTNVEDSGLRSQSSTLSTRKVAEEFSSLLLAEMLKSMRATLSGEGLDGDKSSSREMYAALADGEVTRVLSKRDGIGLADFLERSLSQLESKVGAQESSSVVGERKDPKETPRNGR